VGVIHKEVRVKSKILFAIFTLIIFTSGAGLGVYIGTSSAAGSNVSQLYAGSLELHAVYNLIEKEEYDSAKKLICNSLITRVNILALSKPMIGSRMTSEIDSFKQNALLRNIQRNGTTLVGDCV